MASNVEIVVKTVDASTKETKKISSGFKSMKKDLDKFNLSTNTTDQRLNSMRKAMTTTAALSKQKFGEMSKDAKKPSTSFKDFAKVAATVTAAIVAVGVAARKAFEFGKAGAQFDLLGQSAKNLGVDVEALQDSVGGTISEFAAMNAVNTLVAGTSGNLQTALVGNADKLLEIAKAANAVNPALGSTNFLYESLGKGIKRASPMILDNLGIIVKLEKAQSAMALSLGKTVSELTNEEKQMAILNETIKAGNVLIGQAAGLNTTAADAYAKLGAQGEDAANRLKAAWGIAIAPIVGGLADMIENSNNAADSVNLLKEAAESGKISWEEYSDAVAVLNVDTPAASQAIAELVEKIRILEQSEAQATDQSYLMSLGIVTATSSEEDLIEVTEELADETEELASALADAASRYSALIGAANKDFPDVFGDMIGDIMWLLAGGTGFTKLEEDLKGLAVVMVETGRDGEGNFRPVVEIMEEGIVAASAMQVEAGLITFEEAAASIETDLQIPLKEAEARLTAIDDAAAALDGLQSRVDVLVVITTIGSMPNIPGAAIDIVTGASTNQTMTGPAGQTAPQGFADGGFAKAGSFAVVGEEGPELVGFGSNARVFSNDDSANMMGGGNSGVQHGEMMDMFATFAEQIADSVSANQGAL